MWRPINYELSELRFAYAYHVYLRWQMQRRKQSEHLPRLDRATLDALAERYAIRVLECESGEIEVRLLISLQPNEAVAVAEGKLKGQAAKWLRQQSGERFSRGYFASTSGQSTKAQIDSYLDSQGEHHGYAGRILPPVFVKAFSARADDGRLQTSHAVTVLRFHIVLATWLRRGVFGPQAGEAIAQAWRSLEGEHGFSLLKVSFVPDHVHLAVHVHPTVAPAGLVLALMNASQNLIWRDFAGDAIQARVERLWQPSAYVGSFGDLATPQIAAYLHRWRGRD